MRIKDKKKKEIESERYKEAVHRIVKMGTQENDVIRLRNIYQKMKNGKRSNQIAMDTFIYKVSDFLTYFLEERQEKIKEKPLLSINDILRLLEEAPEILTRDFNHEVKKKMDILDKASWGSIEKTNKIIKKNGVAILKTSNEKLWKLNAILEGLKIKNNDETQNLAEFFFKNGSRQVSNSAEKVFYRLQFMRQQGEIRKKTISKTNFNRALKTKTVFEKQNGITDEILQKRYPLPLYNKAHPEEFKKQIEKSWSADLKMQKNEEDREN